MNAHILAEKAASKCIRKGKINEGLEIRANILSKLGPPSFDQDLKTAFDTKASLHGNYITGRSTRTVKGGNINVSHRMMVDGEKKEKPITTIRAALNYPVRGNINPTLRSDPTAMAKAVEMALPEEFKGKVSVSNQSELEFKNKIKGNQFDGSGTNESKMTLGKAWTLEIEGVGKLTIPIMSVEGKYRINSHLRAQKGAADTIPNNTSVMQNFYLEMNGDLPSEDQLKYAQVMLSMVGSGPVFEKDSRESQEKMKLIETYRAFYFFDALSLDLEEHTYDRSTAELKKLIFKKIKKQPDGPVKAECLKSLNGEGVREIIKSDGRKGLEISGVSKAIREISLNRIDPDYGPNPIFGFMAGVGAKESTFEENTILAGIILRHGLLSTEARYNMGLVAKGASPGPDVAHGGGDGVYMRTIDQQLSETDCKTFRLAGKFQFIIDLDALNEDPHARANNQDIFGFFDPMDITQRNLGQHPNKSVLEVLSQTTLDQTNEVLLTKMLHPKYIKGMVVSNEEEKRMMMESLINDGTAQDGKINGILLNDFIHVSDKFKPEMWNAQPSV
jgi:hypothetical protein